MFIRKLEKSLRLAASHYPVVTVVGPRQSGKTTLVRSVFSDKPYANLENPDVRAFAHEDPRGFLGQYPGGAILDEFQRAPDLLSYLQGIVDEDGACGRFILTGSQHFLTMRDVLQSLAGRTAILTLLPLSLEEIRPTHEGVSADWLMHQGFYPRLYQSAIPPGMAYKDYFQTYVERDVRQLQQVQNLPLFEKFIRLCAGRVGQLLNLTSLGNDVGTSATTARDWLHLLETSFILFRLPPYHANLGKRLVKSPKLYFYDIGLAAYLCGLEEERHFLTHPLRGAFFENMVVAEMLKSRLNQGKDSRLLFYRDSNGNEVDLLYPYGPAYRPVEIKSGQTFTGDWLKSIRLFQNLPGASSEPGLIIYGGKDLQKRSDATVSGIWTIQQQL
jgi:predicted AAA+ superfamily ATPase